MNEMNMTDEEILNNELKFLENFGITYILVNDGTMAILFIDDIHVGYVMKDDNGVYWDNVDEAVRAIIEKVQEMDELKIAE